PARTGTAGTPLPDQQRRRCARAGTRAHRAADAPVPLATATRAPARQPRAENAPDRQSASPGLPWSDASALRPSRKASSLWAERSGQHSGEVPAEGELRHTARVQSAARTLMRLAQGSSKETV